MVELQDSFDILRDITVLDFGDSLPGAVCAHHLALLGARVILAEPSEGCWLRRAGRDAESRGALFVAYGRGRSVAPLAEILAHPPEPLTVVIAPARGDLARTGLPESWKAGRSGGPLSVDFREADGTVLSESAAQAAFGFSAFLGAADRRPLRFGFEAVSYSAGALAVQGVLAVLPYMQRFDAGQRVNVPLSRVCANILNNVITGSVAPDQDVGFSRGWASRPYVGVPASDGQVDFLFYGPGSEENWLRFCDRIGLPELGKDPRFPTSFARTYKAGELAAILAPATSRFPREELLRLLRDCHAMAVPRWGAGEAAASAQSLDNEMVVTRDGGPAPLIASPWEIDGKRAATPQFENGEDRQDATA